MHLECNHHKTITLSKIWRVPLVALQLYFRGPDTFRQHSQFMPFYPTHPAEFLKCILIINDVLTCASSIFVLLAILGRRVLFGNYRFVPSEGHGGRNDEGGHKKGPPRHLTRQEESGVVEWLHSSRTPVSRMTAGRGTEDASPAKKRRATAFQEREEQQAGADCSKERPTISRRGSTAPRGGPSTDISSDDSEASSADDEHSSDSQSR
jgi:hypothetical protein